jgi:hypothetical protein
VAVGVGIDSVGRGVSPGAGVGETGGVVCGGEDAGAAGCDICGLGSADWQALSRRPRTSNMDIHRRSAALVLRSNVLFIIFFLMFVHSG